MIPIELDQLVRHMEWADATLWRAALALPATRDDARIRALLHHVHACQWAYLQLMRADEVDLPELEDFEDVASMRSWGRQYHVELGRFVTRLDPAELDRAVELPWAEELADRLGPIHPPDVRQSLLQVTSHSTYHRGQINTRIREVGGEPPLLDFVAWIWMARPDASWAD